MQWPSDRVQPGGIFQPTKIKYSPETQKFLKVLMDESKLSTMQRQKINYSLRSGDPLPTSLGTNRSEKASLEKYQQKELRRPGTSKRRMFSTIVQSGAYEREQFVPEHPKVDRNKKIERLQDIMYYGKEVKKPQQKEKPRKCTTEANAINRFEELQKAVKEREEWLKEMEKLGEGEKHRAIINQQIASLLREIEALKLSSSSSLSS